MTALGDRLNECSLRLARAEAERNAALAEVKRLREALIPFAFIGRKSMEPLGLAEEYDHARKVLGLDLAAANTLRSEVRELTPIPLDTA